MAEIAFFDLETSVPQRPGQGYALLEFGAILVCPQRLVEVASYATLVRPADLGVVSAATVRCNGITRDAIAAAPPFLAVEDAVYDILHGECPAPRSLWFCNSFFIASRQIFHASPVNGFLLRMAYN